MKSGIIPVNVRVVTILTGINAWVRKSLASTSGLKRLHFQHTRYITCHQIRRMYFSGFVVWLFGDQNYAWHNYHPIKRIYRYFEKGYSYTNSFNFHRRILLHAAGIGKLSFRVGIMKMFLAVSHVMKHLNFRIPGCSGSGILKLEFFFQVKVNFEYYISQPFLNFDSIALEIIIDYLVSIPLYVNNNPN